jgi:hypothetical protein
VNLFTSLVARVLGREPKPKQRPETSVIVADMKAQGDRADAEGDEYREARRGLEGAFFPVSNRENGYAE